LFKGFQGWKEVKSLLEDLAELLQRHLLAVRETFLWGRFPRERFLWGRFL